MCHTRYNHNGVHVCQISFHEHCESFAHAALNPTELRPTRDLRHIDVCSFTYKHTPSEYMLMRPRKNMRSQMQKHTDTRTDNNTAKPHRIGFARICGVYSLRRIIGRFCDCSTVCCLYKHITSTSCTQFSPRLFASNRLPFLTLCCGYYVVFAGWTRPCRHRFVLSEC